MTNPTSLWPAPTSDGPVDAVVAVPGSKSVTNRALLLAALADGPSTLRRPLRSRDTLLMAAALRALGTGIEDLPDGSWRVTPAAGALTGDVSVDVGNAGTVMRFLPPVAALAAGAVRFDGDPRSHERPVRALIEALRALGADVDDSGRPGHFPLSVLGRGRLAGGLVEIDSSASSQFVSALLLVGARFERGVEVRHVGDRLPSLPHIQMTVQMLREAGVTVDDDEPERWAVAPGPIRARDLTIEPDLSNAAPFLAAALVTGGRVTVPDWPEHTTQPGARLREIFTQMGARCTLEAAGLTVAGDGGVHGVDLDLSNEAELTRGGAGRLPLPAVRDRAHPAARDGSHRRAGQGAGRARRGRHGGPGRAGDQPAAAARRGVRHLRGPPPRHRRGRDRPGRGRGARRERRDHRQDAARLPRPLGRDAWRRPVHGFGVPGVRRAARRVSTLSGDSTGMERECR
jgi:3-phosphoshikimate 1-carboxyvinyltransferase